MIIPKYWSETKIKKVVNNRQFTIKRFGWSDISEEDAKQHSEERLQEALNTLEAEGTVRRIDQKRLTTVPRGFPSARKLSRPITT